MSRGTLSTIAHPYLLPTPDCITDGEREQGIAAAVTEAAAHPRRGRAASARDGSQRRHGRLRPQRQHGGAARLQPSSGREGQGPGNERSPAGGSGRRAGWSSLPATSGGQSPRGRGGDEQIHLTTTTLRIWLSPWRLRVGAWLCPAATTAAPDEAMAICLHTTKMRWLQPGEAATMNARGGDPDMLLDDDDGGGRINRIRRLNRGALEGR